MEEVEFYLGLGSNLGDRMGNLTRGLKALGSRLKLTKVSSIYETEPWGYKEQPAFLNCVCAGVTTLSPRQLLQATKEVESLVGRKPTFHGGPRVFDADILFYGQEIVEEPGLQVPHPRLKDRAFVLVPLAEIALEFLHPVEGKTVGRLLDEVDGKEGVRMWGPSPIHAPTLQEE